MLPSKRMKQLVFDEGDDYIWAKETEFINLKGEVNVEDKIKFEVILIPHDIKYKQLVYRWISVFLLQRQK